MDAMSSSTIAAPAAPATRQWPEVRGHWLKGCMRQFQFEPMALYQNAWREHGDYVRLRALPGIPVFMLAHPDAIEHVLHTNHKNYRKPDTFNLSVKLLAGNGILTSEGEFW